MIFSGEQPKYLASPLMPSMYTHCVLGASPCSRTSSKNVNRSGIVKASWETGRLRKRLSDNPRRRVGEVSQSLQHRPDWLDLRDALWRSLPGRVAVLRPLLRIFHKPLGLGLRVT